MSAHAELMREAVTLARRGRGRVEPNPMVGALVVRDGVIVGRGHHADFGGPHAEVAALAEAGPAAEGADVVVTLEPCSTTGKTPACTDALIAAGVGRVIWACDDPNPAHRGAARALLEAAGIATTSGVEADLASGLLDDFVRFLALPRPFVVLKWASTLDGRIATGSGDSRWITGEAARARGHAERARSRGILVGSGTVLADDPELTTRLAPGPSPRRYVLDGRLRTPVAARMLQGGPPVTIFHAAGADPARADALRARGAVLVEVARDAEGLELEAVLRHVREVDRVGRLMVEGGGPVLGSFLARGLADRVEVHLAPRLLGAADGRPALAGPARASMDLATALDDLEVERLGPDLVLTGRPRPRGDGGPSAGKAPAC